MEMPRYLFIAAIVILLSSESVQAQDYSRNRKLIDEIIRFGQADVEIDYPGIMEMDIITRNVSVTGVRDNKVYISLSRATADWFLSRKPEYRICARPEFKGITTASGIEEAMNWESYPSYSDYVSIMQNFVTDYPGICKLDTIGTSINGKLVLALKISDNAGTDESEPEVFYTSTMHGDELAGFVLMLRLADSILTTYSSSPAIKDMVDNLEIWINPLANPDGTYGTGNTITSPIRYNANGVDLNRNFPDPFEPDKVYQRETVDMVKFLRNRSFVLSANFHSGAEVLNYPWDRWLDRIHADDSWFVSVCRSYVDTVHLYSPSSYLNDFNNGIVRGAVWYVIYGGRQDFVTWELQGREVTMEIDDIDQTPAAQLGLLWIYNRRSLLRYLENALFGIHGSVKAEDTSEPVPARIFISGYDKDNSHVYSDSTSGRFLRMLPPGTWNLTFTASGFRDTTVSNITVIAGQKTDLTVFMKPVTTSIDSVDPSGPRLWPNPASGTVRCQLPVKMAGKVEITLVDNSGRAKLFSEINYQPGEIILIDISSLPAGAYFVSFLNRQAKLRYFTRLVVTGRF